MTLFCSDLSVTRGSISSLLCHNLSLSLPLARAPVSIKAEDYKVSPWPAKSKRLPRAAMESIARRPRKREESDLRSRKKPDRSVQEVVTKILNFSSFMCSLIPELFFKYHMSLCKIEMLQAASYCRDRAVGCCDCIWSLGSHRSAKVFSQSPED